MCFPCNHVYWRTKRVTHYELYLKLHNPTPWRDNLTDFIRRTVVANVGDMNDTHINLTIENGKYTQVSLSFSDTELADLCIAYSNLFR